MNKIAEMLNMSVADTESARMLVERAKYNEWKALELLAASKGIAFEKTVVVSPTGVKGVLRRISSRCTYTQYYKIGFSRLNKNGVASKCRSEKDEPDKYEVWKRHFYKTDSGEYVEVFYGDEKKYGDKKYTLSEIAVLYLEAILDCYSIAEAESEEK